MIKRTAIIDIGSNSARLVIFEKTSRYGFHLICEQKSKVRIGEGAYERQGYLQPVGITRAFQALQSFLHTINKYQVHKTLCVATSALRDAPNAQEFTQWIQKTLNLSIEVIDGKQEAIYGAVAAHNLLPIEEGITIDIGGGSSDIALIQKNKIIDSFSLNIGTVRIKELFFDKNNNQAHIYQEAKTYIQKELERLPIHFKHHLAIGIGGTTRTLSKAIMKRTDYPLDKLHAFTYDISEHKDYFKSISLSKVTNLKQYSVKKNRYDTIREGTLIFNEILRYIGAKNVISSSVGVREGVYLSYILNENNTLFPTTVNPSVLSILDRFKPLITIEKKRKMKLKIASSLYQVLQSEIKDKMCYQDELEHALKLSAIGKTLTIYKSHQHAFYIAMQELNYGFTHQQIVLISLLLRMHGKELLNKPLYDKYKSLLPQKQTLKWLSFIYTLAVFLHSASNSAHIKFTFSNNTLMIHSNKPLYLAKEKIKALEKPMDLTIVIEDEDKIPKNKILGV